MNNRDIKFVNSLYSAANEEASSKINLLFVVIVSIIISLIVWANFARIDEITSGEGKVIPSTKIQKVQYFDSGIISEILVKDGDTVTKGQELLKIDTTRFQSTYEETQEHIYSLKVQEIRLKKEMNLTYGKTVPKLTFSKELEFNAKSYVQTERNIFNSNFYERRNTLKIIKLQQQQKEQELKEIDAKIKQLKKSIEFTEEEFKTVKKMVKSGSKSKIELLNIKKTFNTQKGDLEAARLSIPRSKLAIEESKTQIKEKIQTYKSKISIEMQDTVTEIKKIEARLISDNDKLDKTVIKSPANGTIKQININTIGSVVQSGVDLIEIVPYSEILLIEAKIDPKDIAFINPSLTVIIKLTSYDFSIYGGLKGNIIEISADSIKDQDSKDGKSYYKIVVKARKNYIEHKGEKLFIIPGMIATVDIVTGDKSIMDFFLKPILKTQQGALHER